LERGKKMCSDEPTKKEKVGQLDNRIQELEEGKTKEEKTGSQRRCESPGTYSELSAL